MTAATAVAAAALVLSAGAAWAAPAATPIPLGGFGQWRASLNPGRNVPAGQIGTGAISACARVATKAGFSFDRTVNTPLGPEPRVAVAVAIAMAESSCSFGATNHDSNGSRDRGLWQINNAAWPNISNACAYQMQCNANAAFNISAYGSSWSPWATFSNGAWRRYIGSAVAAIGAGFSFPMANQGTGTCLAVTETSVTSGGSSVSNTSSASSSTSGTSGATGTNSTTGTSSTGSAGSASGTSSASDSTSSASSTSSQGTTSGPVSTRSADGTSSANGAPITLQHCNPADDNQQWRVVDVPGHRFILQNVGHGSCLDADGMNKGPGKPVFQWACDSSNPSEQWSFNGSGNLNTNGNAEAGLQNTKDGTCLAAAVASPANGDSVVQGNCAAGDGFQLWN